MILDPALAQRVEFVELLLGQSVRRVPHIDPRDQMILDQSYRTLWMFGMKALY